jgi:hypothetical protein
VKTDEYCREVEAYLCRKNDGHLIRIVGPSFERVRDWAAQGIPLKIVWQGIDAYFVRYYAKGPRRRPVQIDFCEADIFDAFDAWRRAVGVRLPGADGPAEDAVKTRKKSLPDHLDRVRERLVNVRITNGQGKDDFDETFDRIDAELVSLQALPSPIRGEAREQAIAKLAALDRLMMDGARRRAAPADMQAYLQEAGAQLLPFRDRMAPDAFEQALAAAVDRLIRDREHLPTLIFE